MDLADYSVLPRSTFEDVYEPAEDTFALVDALEKDLDVIKSFNPRICLEIGSGSGVVITSLGKVLGPAHYYLCTELNSVAADATVATSGSNQLSVDVLLTDLAECVESRLENAVDLIVCNPPYAPTPDCEVGRCNWEKATSGGVGGRRIIDRLIPLASRLLSRPRGTFYLTCIRENNIDEIVRLLESHQLETSVVLERRCNIERLFVLRANFKGNC